MVGGSEIAGWKDSRMQPAQHYGFFQYLYRVVELEALFFTLVYDSGGSLESTGQAPHLVAAEEEISIKRQQYAHLFTGYYPSQVGCSVYGRLGPRAW